jgi:iron complex outermembrane receptor protein
VLTSVEVGGGFGNEVLRLGLNVFSMSFRDEIIKNGQLDRFGIPVTGNADRTIHQGIELTGALRMSNGLDITANATLSRNRLEEYTVFDEGAPLSLNGNTIAGFPEILANLRATYRRDCLMASVSLQYIGEFYSDNFQNPRKTAPNPNRTVDSHTLVNGWLSYRLPIEPIGKEVEARIQINNLFNVYYASHGEGDEFFPGAVRNIFASLQIDL